MIDDDKLMDFLIEIGIVMILFSLIIITQCL